MEVVVIYNGLGNQMSQYALCLSKKANGENVSCVYFNTGHNGIELERVFNIPIRSKLIYKSVYLVFFVERWKWLSSILRTLLSWMNVHIVYEYGDYSFRKEVLEAHSGVTFYSGGWHNPLYFSDISDIIRTEFIFPAIDDEINKGIVRAASMQNAVAIHVRGGDYQTPGLCQLYGSVCTEEYYKKAMEYMESNIGHSKYYVFTNDKDYAQKLLTGRLYTIVDWNTGENSWKDMALMSKFKNIIISNSTFSWWAAYLGQTDKTILCPPYLQNNNFSSDIFPKEWVRIVVNRTL